MRIVAEGGHLRETTGHFAVQPRRHDVDLPKNGLEQTLQSDAECKSEAVRTAAVVLRTRSYGAPAGPT